MKLDQCINKNSEHILYTKFQVKYQITSTCPAAEAPAKLPVKLYRGSPVSYKKEKKLNANSRIYIYIYIYLYI